MTVAQLKFRELGSGATGAGVRGERGDPVPVDVGDGQLRAGVGAFLADDHAHALGPTLQVQQVGEFGDPCAVAIRRGRRTQAPTHPRDEFEQVRGVDGKENPTEYDNRCEVIQSRTRGSTQPVDPDQHLAARPGPRPVARELRDGALDNRDVVGGGVRPALPDGASSPTAPRSLGPVVNE